MKAHSTFCRTSGSGSDEVLYIPLVIKKIKLGECGSETASGYAHNSCISSSVTAPIASCKHSAWWHCKLTSSITLSTSVSLFILSWQRLSATFNCYCFFMLLWILSLVFYANFYKVVNVLCKVEWKYDNYFQSVKLWN